MLIPELNAILFKTDFKFFMVIASRICKRFLLKFIYDFCIINEDLSYIGGFDFVSVFVMLCHYMLFYGTYIWEVVRKETVVGISCYVVVFS